jgi:aminomethyltransferase
VDQPKRTIFYERHLALGARVVEFGGWDMPLQYPSGTVREHLATRGSAGLFDVSHMGRFVIRGPGAVDFLQHVLTNNVEALDGRPTGAQYTLIANERGGAVDDAYLYRFAPDEYLLVVNAANRLTDREHLQGYLGTFDGVELTDRTEELLMLALQGPASREILSELISPDHLPEPIRNAVAVAGFGGGRLLIGRTGYTGEPVGSELFVERDQALELWDALVERGATPCGLGARDTLRLEAGLPLYGHEFGIDLEGTEFPIFAVPITRFGVSLSPLKGDFVGRGPLQRQFAAAGRIMDRDLSALADLPRMVRPVAVTGRGIAREGSRVFKDGRPIGYVTSGTAVPYWVFDGEGETARPGAEHGTRSVCLAYLDADVLDEDAVTIDVRGKLTEGVVVPYHLRSEAPPYARPILVVPPAPEEAGVADAGAKVRRLLERAAENTEWRQRECVNLIPSEMTASPMVRLLSIMDPAFRYAEHRALEAFYDAEVFFYQGTGFIGDVETLLEAEMSAFLGSREVETRLVSGQMANAAVFSGMVDFLNRTDRRSEPRRLRRVMNHHIGKGGHLSAQPMGALKDFVARDPKTERPAVVNFPVLEHNPYRVDVPATLELIDGYRPELIVFGKSMILHKEPVAEVRAFLRERGIPTVVMYDMAHVLGLIGPHFQEPFAEGADLVTGSTHKTYFGTQRGVVGSRYREGDEGYELWESIRTRAFPGSVSNHHLGTLLGLLMAAYEMNRFKDDYQPTVIGNAKAFARALHDAGLDVAGDPAIGFTETHQVVVRVGYARGPEIARRLEANNLICNYQAVPGDEGFTAAGGLRMGVAEMTRFGMEEDDFRELASLMRHVIVDDADVAEKVAAFRRRFTEMRFCFPRDEFADQISRLAAYL